MEFHREGEIKNDLKIKLLKFYERSMREKNPTKCMHVALQ